MDHELKILFVEDSPTDLELIERTIRKAGIIYSRELVETKVAFMEILYTYMPDIILSDFSMPLFNGLEALTVRNERCPHTPFILITGSNNEEIAVNCMKLGADDYVIKDNLTRLGEAIKGAISKQNEIKNRIEVQKSLKENEELFRTAFESAAIGVCLYTLDLHLFNVNETFCKLTGYCKEELQSMTISDLTYPQDIQLNLEKIDQIRTGVVEHIVYEKRYIHKQGHLIWVNITTGIVHKSQGQTSYFASYIQDITLRKQAEMQLIAAKEKAEESDRLKTSFLNNISHEIRTPMNAIVGFSEFLKQPNLDREKQNYFADIIIRSSNQLLTIINDIVAMATLDAKQMHLKPKLFNLNRLLNIVFQQMLKSAEEQGLRLGLEIPFDDDRVIVEMDETKVVQVLTNLLNNAIKFTSQGSVQFGYLDQPYLCFFVKDTGIGIPPNMREVIFERFRQVDNSQERLYGGSGLGLSITKSYVELMGGKIWLESTIGIGTTFYVQFSNIEFQPLNEFTEEKKTVEINKASAFGLILIVEDEDFNYLLIKEILDELKVDSARAINGLEAVKMATDNNFDLVLMDMKLPRMDGFMATKVIKVNKPDLPVIAMTAYVGERERKKAFEVGCVDFISKPFEKSLFVEKIAPFI